MDIGIDSDFVLDSSFGQRVEFKSVNILNKLNTTITSSFLKTGNPSACYIHMSISFIVSRWYKRLRSVYGAWSIVSYCFKSIFLALLITNLKVSCFYLYSWTYVTLYVFMITKLLNPNLDYNTKHFLQKIFNIVRCCLLNFFISNYNIIV